MERQRHHHGGWKLRAPGQLVSKKRAEGRSLLPLEEGSLGKAGLPVKKGGPNGKVLVFAVYSLSNNCE